MKKNKISPTMDERELRLKELSKDYGHNLLRNFCPKCNRFRRGSDFSRICSCGEKIIPVMNWKKLFSCPGKDGESCGNTLHFYNENYCVLCGKEITPEEKEMIIKNMELVAKILPAE